MLILNGKMLASKKSIALREKFSKLNRKPFLTIIQVGDNFASTKYITHKINKGKELGVDVELIKLPINTSEQKLIKVMNEVNNNKKVDGYLVQLPLPKNINLTNIYKNISISKDVDGLSTMTFGHLLQGSDGIISATPRGIIELLYEYKIKLSGKVVAIVGRSNIVGKPLSQILLKHNATVIMCHSKTDLSILKQADIIISATGIVNIINRELIKKGVVIVDVGINHGEDGKLCGDVNFNDVKNVVSAISPVPGGVGPMTVISLFENLYSLITNKK